MVDVVKSGFRVESLLLFTVKLEHILQLLFDEFSVLLLLELGRAFELVAGIARHFFGSLFFDP